MNFDFSSQKAFNGLLFGKHGYIVKQLESDDVNFDKWIGIYNILEMNKFPGQHDFINSCTTKFCFIILYYWKDTELEKEGFLNKYFKSSVIEYFDEIEDLNLLSEKYRFTLTDFVPSWKVLYPIG
ncbi:hypothetical protein [Emticicia sp. C21]|uniref:hypothetical protein n=1 Tax=Emticicia sp. C21 TaxID=2302915 RepID=UPI000E351E37|nr:hypothetical protein [Emticicia sp. C21]RFS17754.1 hypothetical protein D0T08_00435 [Emticicia sp. C21]